MVSIFFRTILIYIYLLFAMRVMGKRQIGELQISELIVTFMLSELAVNPIANPSMPLLHAVVPILLLLSIEVILSYWMTKSNKMKRILSGKPSIVICRGVMDQKVMAENRLEVDELLAELRQNGIGDPGEVEYAILEENGKVSVFPKAGCGAVTYGELRHGVRESGIAHPVIIDGELLPEQLGLAGRDTEWVERILAERRAVLEEVFLLTVNDIGGVYFVRREK